jgi:uncharacterized membrane protein YgcG
MPHQVKTILCQPKTERKSYLVKGSLKNRRILWLATLLLGVIWPLSSARAESKPTTDEWAIGASAEGSASAVVPVASPAPAASPGGSVVRHSTAAIVTDTPSAQPGTPAAPTPTPADASEYEDTDASALEVFRPDLDPYGRWVDDSRYGRVWVPDAQVVGTDFAPYVSNGHWALDVDNNWVWESNYPFGGVVFHYGRWVWIDSLGWSWVPGRRYAPAWVVWRVPTGSYSYVGWAPAPPTFVWFGMGISWLSYYPPLPFVFCPSHYVFYSNFGPYLVHDHRFAATLVHHSVWYSTAPVYGRGYVSPPIDRARVPARVVPSQRVSANPRAAALARPSGVPRTGGGRLGAAAGHSSPRPAWGGSVARPGMVRDSGRPSLRDAAGSRANRPASYTPRRVQSLGTTPATGYSSPRDGSPRYSAPYGGTPAYRPSYSTPNRGYSAPTRSYSAPSRGYSTPRVSPPSGSGYSAPRSSFGSGSHSAPTRSYSAPSFSSPRSFGGGSFGGGVRSGGGSVRGGGGRHR